MQTSIPLKPSVPTDEDLAFRREAIAFLRGHLKPDSSDRLLALASQMVGMLIAMQDQRVMSPNQAMDIVSINLQAGNFMAISDLLKGAQGKPN